MTESDDGSTPRPAPQVRHGRQRTPSGTAFVLRWIGIGLAVVLVSVVAVSAYAVTAVSTQLSANSVDIGPAGAPPPPPPPLLGAVAGGFNLLIVAKDNSDQQGEDYGDREGATLNDANMLLHVSADHKSAVVVSFPRDMVIAQPKCTDPDTGDVAGAVSALPLNSAWSRGKLPCVVATVSALTDLPITYAADISFAGVINMADAVGGVDVCLTDPVHDTETGLDLPAGHTTITGEVAAAFLRTRYAVGDGGDLSRISSQQQYLSSLLRTVRQPGGPLTDVTKLYGLAKAATSLVATDDMQFSSSLAGIDSMVSLALALKDVDLSSVVFVQYPVLGDPDDSNKLVPYTSVADKLFASIAADQPFGLGDDATGNGSTLVAGPEATDTASPSPDADVPDAGGLPSTGVTAAPPPSGPPVIDGVKGQTAAQETCAKANPDY
jgi:LCP family protein required for cell wall assembly